MSVTEPQSEALPARSRAGLDAGGDTPRAHDAAPQSDAAHDHHAPGTMVLVLVLLAAFAVYYFANWKALSDVWHVR